VSERICRTGRKMMFTGECIILNFYPIESIKVKVRIKFNIPEKHFPIENELSD
jgi:hypothetical protein